MVKKMSYCVNCGVELAESEKLCPLCQTEVINPRAPWRDPLVRPYPQALDQMMHRIDRRYLAALISVFMLIPVIVVLLSDWLIGGLSWSRYVLGAAALLEIWVAVPLASRRYHRMPFLALDCLASILYLFAVERISGSFWFLPLALPISVAASILLLGCALLFKNGRGRRLLVRIIICLFCIGLMAIVVEISTDIYLRGAFHLNWSLFAMAPCLILDAALLILDSKNSLKEEIHKRIFY